MQKKSKKKNIDYFKRKKARVTPYLFSFFWLNYFFWGGLNFNDWIWFRDTKNGPNECVLLTLTIWNGPEEAAVHGREGREEGVTHNALLREDRHEISYHIWGVIGPRKNNISTNEANREGSLR